MAIKRQELDPASPVTTFFYKGIKMAHTPIKGYRELTSEELLSINQIKELENEIGHMMNTPTNNPPDQRMVALARTNLQQGFMWWVRAITQPKSEL